MRKTLGKIVNKIRGIYHRFPNQKYPIKYAFTCGGIDYYEMDDIFNLPYQRALKATAAYEEIRMKCTYEYLLWYQKAVQEELSGTKFTMKNAARVQMLNAQLGERLSKWAIDLSHVYRLASIVYFDKSEKPEVYDFKYADEKIAHWKKSEDMNAFFLRQPIQRLIPFLKDSGLNFQIYSEIINQLKTLHLDTVQGSLSEQQRKQFTGWRLRSSAMEMQPN